MRIEIGPRDLEAGQCVIVRRDNGEKVPVSLDEICDRVTTELNAMHNSLFQRAVEMRDANTRRVDTWAEFKASFEGEGGGGFIVAHWDGTAETEDKINDETKATIRCIPLVPLATSDAEPGVCVYSGRPSKCRVVFAKAY
jgi:prolyl-tRNA synthetase